MFSFLLFPSAMDPAFSRVYPLSASSDDPGPPPMLSLYAAATSPPRAAPKLASQGLIHIHPVKLDLAEGPLTRIASFFADGVIVKRSAIAPDPPDGALHSLRVLVDEVDVSVPVKLEAQKGKAFGPLSLPPDCAGLKQVSRSTLEKKG